MGPKYDVQGIKKAHSEDGLCSGEQKPVILQENILLRINIIQTTV